MKEAGFISASAAAEACGRDLSTLHRWADQGKVDAVRSGRRLFVRLDSVAALHKGNRVILNRLEELR